MGRQFVRRRERIGQVGALSTEEIHEDRAARHDPAGSNGAGSDGVRSGRFAGVADRWRRGRERIGANRTLDLTYRIVVGIVGTLVLCAGIVAIPYPGPGWLIVFAGLGILASEFEWAHRVLRWVRVRYDAFMDWFVDQSIWVRALGVIFTCAVVLVTLWVLGAMGMAASLVGLDQAWLQSPF